MKRLFSIVTLVVIFATVLIGVSSNLSPEVIGPLAFGWFAYPYLLLLIVAVVLPSWCLNKRVTSCLGILAIGISFPLARRLVSVIPFKAVLSSSAPQAVSLVTFNVQFFDSCSLIRSGLSADEKSAHDLEFASLIDKYNPDVICIQEANGDSWLAKRQKNLGPKFNRALDAYPYLLTKGTNGGFAVFSKFPLKKSSLTDGMGGVLAVEVAPPGAAPFTLFNCHLHSIMLNKDEKKAISSDGLRNGHDALFSDYRKVRSAFDARAKEVRELADAIGRVQGPLIVCGDFNDTPISYTYSTLLNAQTADGAYMADSFVGSGAMLGTSFTGLSVPLRIDYVWTSDQISVASSAVPKVNLSDHRPVAVSLSY